ncbi:GTP-binding protein [Dipsacomyces acuminosporus]|nr:GTP-binding protein [Dipsacomyces acuminosporus]
MYVIAFSVATRKSFEMARVIHGKILDITGTDKIPMILAGNKIDLQDERQVSKEEAEELAKEFGCPYIETSAKKNEGVEKMFVRSITETYKQDGNNSDGKAQGSEGTGCIIM